jgi:hypothetical protein
LGRVVEFVFGDEPHAAGRMALHWHGFGGARQRPFDKLRVTKACKNWHFLLDVLLSRFR